MDLVLILYRESKNSAKNEKTHLSLKVLQVFADLVVVQGLNIGEVSTEVAAVVLVIVVAVFGGMQGSWVLWGLEGLKLLGSIQLLLIEIIHFKYFNVN